VNKKSDFKINTAISKVTINTNEVIEDDLKSNTCSELSSTRSSKTTKTNVTESLKKSDVLNLDI